MDHVGIVVDDLADAVAFFVELGLELQGEAPVEGDWVDRVVGLEGVRAQIAMLRSEFEVAQKEATRTSGQDQTRAGVLAGDRITMSRMRQADAEASGKTPKHPKHK